MLVTLVSVTQKNKNKLHMALIKVIITYFKYFLLKKKQHLHNNIFSIDYFLQEGNNHADLLIRVEVENLPNSFYFVYLCVSERGRHTAFYSTCLACFQYANAKVQFSRCCSQLPILVSFFISNGFFLRGGVALEFYKGLFFSNLGINTFLSISSRFVENKEQA